MDPGQCLWVADAYGWIIGTVAIRIQEEDRIAHLRRLRIAPECDQKQRVIAALVDVATAHAREQNAVKLVFHTPLDAARAIDLLGGMGFQFARTRRINGRQALEFYVNLYDRIGSPTQESSRHGDAH